MSAHNEPQTKNDEKDHQPRCLLDTHAKEEERGMIILEGRQQQEGRYLYFRFFSLLFQHFRYFFHSKSMKKLLAYSN